ncbi:unnamed protein product, partial [Pocillopora meandrina]
GHLCRCFSSAKRQNETKKSTSPSHWTVESSYRRIKNFTNKKMGITVSALKELSKKQGRTFHVTTVSNSTSEAVVEYFSGLTDVRPDSCGSFQRMEDDNFKSVMECESWNYEGKWGWNEGRVEVKLYIRAAYVPGNYHCRVLHGYWCDDL